MEVDQDELEEAIVCSVTKPIEKEKDVEQEIIRKFGEICVTVEEMKTFSDNRGYFDKCRVKVSSVNLKSIWEDSLSLTNVL